jgi:hypothetical protein
VPCVLITACGFPSLAVRALVQHVVKVYARPFPCRGCSTPVDGTAQPLGGGRKERLLGGGQKAGGLGGSPRRSRAGFGNSHDGPKLCSGSGAPVLGVDRLQPARYGAHAHLQAWLGKELRSPTAWHACPSVALKPGSPRCLLGGRMRGFAAAAALPLRERVYSEVDWSGRAQKGLPSCPSVTNAPQTSFAFDAYCCPELIWVGLHTADILKLEQPPNGAAAESARPTLSPDNFRPFGDRDQAVMDGLLRRQVSVCHTLGWPACPHMIHPRQKRNLRLYLQLLCCLLAAHAYQTARFGVRYNLAQRACGSAGSRSLPCTLLSALMHPAGGLGGCGAAR